GSRRRQRRACRALPLRGAARLPRGSERSLSAPRRGCARRYDRHLDRRLLGALARQAVGARGGALRALREPRVRLSVLRSWPDRQASLVRLVDGDRPLGVSAGARRPTFHGAVNRAAFGSRFLGPKRASGGRPESFGKSQKPVAWVAHG